jgi:hypothetical protein
VRSLDPNPISWATASMCLGELQAEGLEMVHEFGLHADLQAAPISSHDPAARSASRARQKGAQSPCLFGRNRQPSRSRSRCPGLPPGRQGVPGNCLDTVPDILLCSVDSCAKDTCRGLG